MDWGSRGQLDGGRRVRRFGVGFLNRAGLQERAVKIRDMFVETAVRLLAARPSRRVIRD